MLSLPCKVRVIGQGSETLHAKGQIRDGIQEVRPCKPGEEFAGTCLRRCMDIQVQTKQDTKLIRRRFLQQE